MVDLQRSNSKDSLFSIASEAPCSEVFYIGEKCKIDKNRVGVVAFVGRTSFAAGEWVGLISEKPDGKNNGTVNGVCYFECKEKHGIFCRPSKLSKIYSSVSPSFSNSPGPPSPAFSISKSIASTTVATHRLRSIYAHESGYDVGDRVTIPGGKNGVVKFLDRINNELYAGIQLDRPLGSCDGTFNGVHYFKCNPLYGIFVAASRVKKCSGITKPAQIEVRHTKTSTLRTWKGSQESLNSIGFGSVCSNQFNSPKFVKSGVKEIKESEFVANLKLCLQEKEAHLVSLTKELSEIKDRFSSVNSEKTAIDNFVSIDCFLEIQKYLEDEKQKCRKLELKKNQIDCEFDDLIFKLDEAEMRNSNLEAEINVFRIKLNELQEKLRVNSEKMEYEVGVQLDGLENEVTILKNDANVQVNLFAENKSIVKKDVNIQAEIKKNVLINCTQTETKNFQEFGVQCIQKMNDSFTQSLILQTNDCFIQTDSIKKLNQNVQKKKITTCESSHQTENLIAKDSDTQTESLNLIAKDSDTQTELFNNVITNEAEVQTFIFTKDFNAQFSQLEKIVNDSSVQTMFKNKELNEFGTQTKVPNLSYEHFKVQEIVPLPSASVETQTIEFIQNVSVNVQTDNNNLINAGTQCEEVKKISKDTASDPINYISTKLNHSQTQTNILCISSKEIQCDKIESPIQYPKPSFSYLLGNSSNTLKKESNNLIINGSLNSKKNMIQELDVLKLLNPVSDNLPLSDENQNLMFKLREQNGKINQLESTVSFLNSIISDQNLTINKQKNEIRQNNSNSRFDNDDETINKIQINETKKKKIREYCDHCEVFDVHDTNDCPKEAVQRDEFRSHIATFSPLSKLNSAKTPRSFCNYCEAFVHPTNECPDRT